MLSVAVQKDISEYQPKIIGHLTVRTTASIALALGMSIITAIYMYFVLGLNVTDHTFVIYAVSIPFWCCGFVRPHGLPFEQFVPLWLKSEFANNVIEYVPSMRLAGFVSNLTGKERDKSNEKYHQKQCKLKGIESYSPRAGRVIV